MIEGLAPIFRTDRLPASKEWVFRLARPLVRLGLRLGGESQCTVHRTFRALVR